MIMGLEFYASGNRARVAYACEQIYLYNSSLHNENMTMGALVQTTVRNMCLQDLAFIGKD